MQEDKDTKYVRWVNFVWAIGILTTIVLAGIGVSMSAKADASAVSNKYETDIVWIRDSLSEIKATIKSKD